jgi:hypothetical protein
MLSRIGIFTLPFLALSSELVSRAAAGEPPSANEIMRQAIARVQRRSDDAVQPAYTYRKVTVTEELDSAGKVTDRQERVYEGQFQSGATFLKLIEVNGKPLGDAEKRKQAENETKYYRMLGQSKNGKGDRRENFLTEDLVGRFDFTLAGRESIDGRAAYMLKFQPKKPAPATRQFLDRILNRISGSLWVDTDDFEIARIEIKLGSSVDLLGGVLASLKKMAFTVVRTRLADGQWFNTTSDGEFEGRKLFDTSRSKTSSRSTNFRPVALR